MHQEILARDGSTSSAIDVRGEDPILARDGHTLILTVWDDANEVSLGHLDLNDPNYEITMLADTPFVESAPALSPDQRFVAYESLESGQREIIVQSFPDGKGKWQVSREGGSRSFWSATGDRLYFVSPSGRWLQVVDVSSDPTRFSTPRRLFRISGFRSLSARPEGGFAALQVSGGEQQGGYEIWLNWANRVNN